MKCIHVGIEWIKNTQYHLEGVGRDGESLKSRKDQKLSQLVRVNSESSTAR